LGNQSEIEKLKQAIQAFESQRQTLGDAVVEAALAPLREKLASLQTSALGEQRKLVSVLFSDLVGFTSLASQMDPEDVREVINAYFSAGPPVSSGRRSGRKIHWRCCPGCVRASCLPRTIQNGRSALH
jgi:hypothetical protein